VTFRARGLCITVSVIAAIGAVLFGLAAVAAIHDSASGRSVSGLIGLALAVVAVRVARSGIQLEPNQLTVRGLSTTERLGRAEVADAVGRGPHRRQRRTGRLVGHPGG
jgi:hypothetical protein